MRRKLGWSFVLGLLGSGAMCLSGAYGQGCYNNACAPAVMSMSDCGDCQPADCGGCESAACGGCQSASCGGCQNGCQLKSRLGEHNCGERFESFMENRFGCNNECAEDLGDPWTLFGRNCDDPWLNMGGWFQMGYYSRANDLFHDLDNTGFRLHQAWFFAEKAAESKCGELAFGFRFDGMYGLDADDTQAFGNPTNVWDLDPGFTRGGGYGWALPQLYGEIAKGDWNVKVGHFYTLAGYEVVTAPDNFFFSHAITQFNSEPFTHTGAIASYEANDDVTIYGGWTAGWDTGFDFSTGSGSNFLGGFSAALTEDATLTYITTFGDFGVRGDDAYHHSFVLDHNISENLNQVVVSDLVSIASTGEDSFSLAHYAFYQCSPRIAFGKRTEWWKGDDVVGYAPFGGVSPGVGSQSHYEGTWGFNLFLNANVRFRPEYRFQWSPAQNYDQSVFAIDMVATY